MYIERETDRLMRRTASRPLPTGRLSPETALWFALACGVVGLTVLVLWVNLASAGLALLALVSYVLAYTPLKRSTGYALHVGAIPGAIPPLIGWASMTGSLAPRAFPLFLILLVWQLPHFLAIATFRREEYARAGLVVQPNASGLAATRRSILIYSVLLLVVSWSPLALGMAGLWYAVVATLLGLAFLGYAAFGRGTNTVDRWSQAALLGLAAVPRAGLRGARHQRDVALSARAVVCAATTKTKPGSCALWCWAPCRSVAAPSPRPNAPRARPAPRWCRLPS